MPRTPDRYDGTREETSILFEDQTSEGNPGEEGLIRRVSSRLVGFFNGAVKFLDVQVTGAAPVNVTKAAAAVGTSIDAARADHKHDVSTAAPSATGLGTTSGEGSATSLARSDHTHQSNTAPVAVTKAAAVIGTSGEPARADHKHDVDTAAPVTLTPDQANAEGSATTLARSDHVHQVPAETAVDIQAGGTSSEGAAASFARSDHVHRIADPSTEVSATGSISTTSSTPTIATGMTITPSAGTYLVWFSSWGGHTNNNARLAIAIGVAGTIAPNSTREVGGTNQSDGMAFNLSTQARVTVNGSQAIQGGYWRSTGGGSVVLFDRTLTILKVDG